jgi:dienelactone hydrolase
VVAYKGTDFLLEFSGRAWNTVGDMMTNAGLASDKAAALGLGQQLNAMAYYLAVKDWAVDNGHDPAKISFTGHSLGGGLAANMAAAIVAITAQATFSGSAAVLDEINRVRQLLVGELLWQEEFDRREAAVTNIYNAAIGVRFQLSGGDPCEQGVTAHRILPKWARANFRRASVERASAID